MKSTASASVIVLLAVSAAPASAQAVKVEFDNGTVTLVAQNAPVRAILAEWARLGGATIVNGDRMIGAPVTLQLTAVPERQALDVVLRGAAGYMLAPRRAGSKAASTFDRILILPTSTAPRPTPGAAPTPFAGPRPQQPQVRQSPGPPGAVGGDPADAADDPNDGPIIVGGPPAPPRIPAAARPVPRPIGVEPEVIGGDDGPNQQPVPQPTPATQTPTTVNPFTVPAGSSARPGVIAPVPQPQPQRPNAQ